MRAEHAENLQGVTLVEVIIWTGIFALLAVAMMRFQQDFLQVNNWSQGGLMREGQIRKVFKDFVSEVRSASIMANTAALVIEKADATSFIFFVDTDGDGLYERIRYFISGTSLQKGTIKPTGCPNNCVYAAANESIKTVATEVTNTTAVFFYYDVTYDGSQAALVQPVDTSAVRLIRMQLTIDPNGPLAPGPQTFETQANIRNLRQL